MVLDFTGVRNQNTSQGGEFDASFLLRVRRACGRKLLSELEKTGLELESSFCWLCFLLYYPGTTAGALVSFFLPKPQHLFPLFPFPTSRLLFPQHCSHSQLSSLSPSQHSSLFSSFPLPRLSRAERQRDLGIPSRERTPSPSSSTFSS